MPECDFSLFVKVFPKTCLMDLSSFFETSQNKEYDVYGIGNAIVDLLVFVEEEFIHNTRLSKGHMKLATLEEQAKLLYQIESFGIHMTSGGSAANTMITVANAGGKPVFTGKVASDTHGEFYRVNLHEAGVTFFAEPIHETFGSTGTCIVFVTPDAERTMSTHLGVSILLQESDINEEVLKKARMVFIEGYLWLTTATKQAALKAIDMAKFYHIPVGFSFSDSFVVELFRKEFEEKIRNQDFHILFMNAEEIRAFFDEEDYRICLEYLLGYENLFFVTNSEKGANVVYRGSIHSVPGFPVKPLDTTGAGDCFAGGVIYGLTHRKTPEEAARIGNYLASHVVRVQGARLPKSFAEEIQQML